MFRNCTNFNQSLTTAPGNTWKMNNVVTVEGMFLGEPDTRNKFNNGQAPLSYTNNMNWFFAAVPPALQTNYWHNNCLLTAANALAFLPY